LGNLLGLETITNTKCANSKKLALVNLRDLVVLALNPDEC
jgi:hypothetical protein